MAMQVVSDLHLESHADRGVEFIKQLIPVADTLVVAGDLCVGVDVPPALGLLCNKFKTVVYVHGNHELHGSSFLVFRQVLRRAQAMFRNLVVLDNDVATIDGRRVLGTTLWFPDSPFNAPAAHLLDDFALIEDFRLHVYRENAAAVAFLRRELCLGDVVVTHHVPTPRSITPRFVNSPLTPFFLCNLSDLILDRRPAVWIHGHTHASMDYLHGRTRVVCNPCGYPQDLNSAFQPRLLI